MTSQAIRGHVSARKAQRLFHGMKTFLILHGIPKGQGSHISERSPQYIHTPVHHVYDGILLPNVDGDGVLYDNTTLIDRDVLYGLSDGLYGFHWLLLNEEVSNIREKTLTNRRLSYVH